MSLLYVDAFLRGALTVREPGSLRFAIPPVPARPRRPARRRPGGRRVGPFRRLVQRPRTSTRTRSSSAFAVAIGLAGALGVVAFYRLIDLAYYAALSRPGGLPHPSRASSPTGRCSPAPGLSIAWMIMRGPGRGYDGANVPDVRRAIAREGGRIAAQPALARTAASAVTLGCRRRGRQRGPGRGARAPPSRSFLGRAFRFDPARTKILVAAGAAAGISAAFNAPLAGAFFALEEILGSLAVGAFPPVVVASVVAAVVSHSFLGNHPAFPIPDGIRLRAQARGVPLLPLSGRGGRRSRGALRAGLLRHRGAGPPAAGAAGAAPWLGGALVGVLVLLSKGLLVGHGHLAVHLEVFGRMSASSLALLALGSIVATSITLNSRRLGRSLHPFALRRRGDRRRVRRGAHRALPHLGLRPEAYALVGMGAVVAAATAAPITGILLVFEMTNDYAIVLPLMLTTVIANLVARRIEPDSLYSGWLRRRGERVEHGTDRDVLAGLTVSDAFDPAPQVVSEEASLDVLLAHLGQRRLHRSPGGGRRPPPRRHHHPGRPRPAGRRAAGGRGARSSHSTWRRPPRRSRRAIPCWMAVRKMGVRGAPSIPVVDPRTGRLLGLVSRAHILALYERTVAGSSSGSRPAFTERAPTA